MPEDSNKNQYTTMEEFITNFFNFIFKINNNRARYYAQIIKGTKLIKFSFSIFIDIFNLNLKAIYYKIK